jgi:thiol-disulfide isomerase/thioredoxin
MTARSRVSGQPRTTEVRLPVEGQMPSLDGATRWLNSPPLEDRDLRGKVVLVNFWTYTCIKCIKTRPFAVERVTRIELA